MEEPEYRRWAPIAYNRTIKPFLKCFKKNERPPGIE